MQDPHRGFVQTLKFAARVDRETMEIIVAEARRAHQHYNDLIARHNAIGRRQHPATLLRARLARHRKRLQGVLTRAQDVLLREQAHAAGLPTPKRASAAKRRKLVMPQPWADRFDQALQCLADREAVLRAEHGAALETAKQAQERCRELRLGRRSARITDVEQQALDQSLLEAASSSEIQLGYERANIDRRAMKREARRQAGQHCSTYMLTEDAADRATAGRRLGRFRVWRFRKRHRVGIQELPNNGTRVVLGDLGLTSVPSGEFGTHRLRVTIAGHRSELRAVMHRLERGKPHHRISLDAVIRTGWLQIERRPNGRWDLYLVLTTELDRARTREPARVVGVDLGYRRESEEAITVGATSEGQVIQTPDGYVQRIEHARSLAGFADRMSLEMWTRHFGAVPKDRRGRDYPARWLHAQLKARLSWGPHQDPSAYEKLNGVEASMMWKNGDRTYRVYRRQHQHLTEWAASERAKALRYRREHYRVLAQSLANTADVIAVEDINLSQLARTRTAGGQRVDASPFELRQCLENAARKYGAQMMRVPHAYTSQTCSACGVVHPSGVARERERFDCPSCGYAEHADINAARNIAALGYPRPEVPAQRHSVCDALMSPVTGSARAEA